MQSSNNGYDNLISGFTDALEINSQDICDALEALSQKELTQKDKSALKKIQKELKRIDKDLSGIE